MGLGWSNLTRTPAPQLLPPLSWRFPSQPGNRAWETNSAGGGVELGGHRQPCTHRPVGVQPWVLQVVCVGGESGWQVFCLGRFPWGMARMLRKIRVVKG